MTDKFMAYFKIISLHLPGEFNENRKKLDRDS